MKDLERLLRVIRHIRMIEPHFSLMHLYIFCYVAIYEGVSVGEVSKELGEPQSSVSRYLSDMAMFSSQQRKRKLAWIDIRADIGDRRIRNIFLSDRGKALVGNLNSWLQGATFIESEDS